MRFGYAPTFQNPGGARPDREVWTDELELIELAIDVGFDSVWATEHHFTSYEMSPAPLQLLAWVCGRRPGTEVGTMVLVLPWHDPVRVVEEAVVLDHLAAGRFTLGVGRGTSPAEHTGIGVPVSEADARFDASVDVVAAALASGRMGGSSDDDRPEREIRPRPFRSLEGRFYAAPSVSSPEDLARRGAGLLLLASRSLEDNSALLDRYTAVWTRMRPSVPVPRPVLHQFTYVHEDAAEAEERAHLHLAAYHQEYVRHHATTASTAADLGAQTEAFIRANAWGTPEQVADRLTQVAEALDPATVLLHASYGGLTREQAGRSIALFARQVIPTVRGSARSRGVVAAPPIP